ncbi:hypothetical protein Val02_47110 [Virgisporangium aliadipatigenens]|uniref:Uncharacterized protein n=1 Tax=Virgisporangium aliadipatigenens TaxID=741659 RepID=A0A8J3YPX8_9ACTN|nr:hypothetical protein [Virgisporangium aliadipatigenens]GIJ47825.1 hypothetical protein Val02_47110 [Virgisporangium aliadipatigenens]
MRLLAAAAAALLLAPFVATPAHAAGRPPEFRHELLAKAQPDECFNGVGQPYPAGPPCTAGQAKVNQAYVWGTALAGNRLWFGTGANLHCLTSGRTLDFKEPTLNDDWVCEYGRSQIAQRNPNLPHYLGDHRMPRLYMYDVRNRSLTEKTSAVTATPAGLQMLQATAGIRSAGTHRGVVFFAGPSISATMNMFAFDADTGAYLGAKNFTGYGNIRHFLVADGALYAGVGVGANGSLGGHVLRWVGSKADPFAFVSVANLTAQAADLAFHDGRVFVTTWPASAAAGAADEETSGEAPSPLAAVWMSPRLSTGAPGLDPADADGWQQVWSVTEYEPDLVTSHTYALGGLASYGGYLYWGTMHVPLKATTAHLELYPPKDEAGTRATIENTQRATVIFRGKDFGSSRERTELLYGAAQLPAYDPAAAGGAGAWNPVATGYTPKYGSAGFGEPFLNYTWKMVVSAGKLFVGTMDWSYLAKELQTPLTGINIDPAKFGGDLYVFDSTTRPARAVDKTGLGNYLNYGVRNMVADGSTLYLGMADPMNLRTDPDDDVPQGGWELVKLTVDCR